jgi:CO/xanthine dehydrogenase Mo-binding subunit
VLAGPERAHQDEPAHVRLLGRGTIVIRVVDGADRPAENAFVRIRADNTVTVIVKHREMCQGTYTGLPTLVAEELDADWYQIRA